MSALSSEEMNDAEFHFLEVKGINVRMNTKFYYNGRNSVNSEYNPHTEQQRPPHQTDDSSSDTVCVSPMEEQSPSSDQVTPGTGSCSGLK